MFDVVVVLDFVVLIYIVVVMVFIDAGNCIVAGVGDVDIRCFIVVSSCISGVGRVVDGNNIFYVVSVVVDGGRSVVVEFSCTRRPSQHTQQPFSLFNLPTNIHYNTI